MALVSVIVFVVGMLVVLVISTAVSKPLVQMVQTVREIEQGDLSQRARIYSEDEAGVLAKAFNRMVE